MLENPVSGERIIIRESGDANGGGRLVFDHFLPPGGHVPAGHVHPEQEERFTILEGRMRFRMGRRNIVATPGQIVVIPKGAAHWFGNAGPGISHARVEVRPALRMQQLFEATEAIGRSGRLPGTRLPRISDLASVVLEFQREVAVPHVPAAIVTLVLAPLAWLGRRRRRAASQGAGR